MMKKLVTSAPPYKRARAPELVELKDGASEVSFVMKVLFLPPLQAEKEIKFTIAHSKHDGSKQIGQFKFIDENEQ